MKFGKVGQVGLVSVLALTVSTLFTACNPVNVGYLFVATNKQTPGQIEVYKIDPIAGYLRVIPTSPFPSGGRNPIAEAVSPDFKNLYVVNGDDNNIVQFGIGTDGKLYAQSTINTPGAFPLALAINTAGTFLYVVDTLQPIAGCTPNNPCPGDIAVYPIDPKTGAPGTPIANSSLYPTFWPILKSPSDTKTVLTPPAVQVLANGSDVYVTAYSAATATAPATGYIFGFSSDSTGALTPLNNGLPWTVGNEPVALTSDSGSAFLYVADKLANNVTSYAVQSGGTLTAQSSATTGGAPSALTLYAGNFLYVTSSGDSTVSTYTVSSGNLTKTQSYASDTNPISILVDPKGVGYLYTVNFLGNSLSGYQLDPNTGALINTQNSPYPSIAQPTAIAGVPHGGTAKAK
jgi:6-phosphogluconolactonase